MSYKQLFVKRNKLFASSAPVSIEATALLLEKETYSVYAQLKLKNISAQSIKYLTVELSMQDPLERQLAGTVSFSYMDFVAAPGECFGADRLIELNDRKARGFTITVKEVGFADNTIWCGENVEWEELLPQPQITTLLKNVYQRRAYKAQFGERANYLLQKNKSVWRCCCGQENSYESDKCHACGASMAALEAIDPTLLEREGVYLTAKAFAADKEKGTREKALALFARLGDYKDSVARHAALVKKEQQIAAAAPAPRKSGKVFAISSSALALCLAIVLVSVFWIVPANRYSQATRAYNEGDYLTAHAKYSSINYKDSADKAAAVSDKMLADIEALVAKGSFDRAAMLAEDYADVSDTLAYAYVACEYLKKGSYSKAYDCYEFASITIKDVTMVPVRAFENCKGLVSVVLDSSVTSIGAYAFEGCTNLESVTLGRNVDTIGAHAFEGCSSLESIAMSDNLTTIGGSAFKDCSSLVTVSIPASVTQIGVNAFENCDKLRNVYFSNITGWRVTSNYSSVILGTILSTNTAAVYLRSLYCSYVWSR